MVWDWVKWRHGKRWKFRGCGGGRWATCMGQRRGNTSREMLGASPTPHPLGTLLTRVCNKEKGAANWLPSTGHHTQEIGVKMVPLSDTFSILMLYLLSFCFPSPLLFFLALLLNYLIFHDFSLRLCEKKSWRRFLFNLISFYLSTSPFSLDMGGGDEPFLSRLFYSLWCSLWTRIKFTVDPNFQFKWF